MDLSIYQIIKGPIVSEKAYKLNQLNKKLVLEVHPKANKPMIKEAIEKLFSVKVRDVRVIIRKGKIKRDRKKKRLFRDSLSKRAIITLKEGYSLDSISQAGTQAVVTGAESASTKESR